MTSPAPPAEDFSVIFRKQEKIDKARAAALPDGVFQIVAYNSVHFTGWPNNPRPHAIDPYEVFADVPREVLDEWIQRARKLFGGSYELGDAIVGKYPSAARLRHNFIAANPGFSQDSYEYAIYLSAVGAR
jgi:hypothetical protein